MRSFILSVSADRHLTAIRNTVLAHAGYAVIPATSVQMSSGLIQINQQIIACERCPRLITYCRKIGREKRRAYMDWEYWAKPVPGWGDPKARVLILGLAPGAHGSNRTGRPFTGDGSGYF